TALARRGRPAESGRLAELRHMPRPAMIARTDQPWEGLRDVPGVHDVEDDDDGEVRFQVDGDRVDEAVRALAPLGVRSLVAHPPTLEQLLMRHYDDDGGGGQ